MRVTKPGPFLTARWERLLMLNYEVDPSLLQPHVPAGTELDLWNGRCFVSVVGFQFLDTRVLGLSVPLHRNFPEVNLRFYVRRQANDETRRGVVFIREIVPKRPLAWIANAVYNEKYVALPMTYSDREGRISYSWTLDGGVCEVAAYPGSEAAMPEEGSQEQFITEHYWGYTSQRDGSTLEYRVEHPPWRVTPALEASVSGDVARLYGHELARCLSTQPSSSFMAEGSGVVVHRGVRLPGGTAG